MHETHCGALLHWNFQYQAGKSLLTNVTGLWIMCQQAEKIMAAQNYGRIINLASIVSFVGSMPEQMDSVVYTTSKAAVSGLTKDLAVKWARHK